MERVTIGQMGYKKANKKIKGTKNKNKKGNCSFQVGLEA
jgi:hypothetical protein